MKEIIFPERIIESENVTEAENVLLKQKRQIGLTENRLITLKKGGFLILDFTRELSGGIRILTHITEGYKPADLRIRFGESLTECNSDIGYKGATNAHSPRDFVVQVPFLSDLTFGRTGFRFVRIDNLSDGEIKIKSIFAENIILKKKAKYYYNGRDKEILKIFEAAKRTIDLCAGGEYLWDGVKRDRLVWIGDMHPEMLALTTLYGRLPIIERSLDFVKEQTPLPQFMNGFPTYSLWWIIIICDYYEATKNKKYLDKQIDYMNGLIDLFDGLLDENGKLNYACFVDWPTKGTQDEETGSRFINIIAVKKATEILSLYKKDTSTANRLMQKLLKGNLKIKEKKQVIALKYFALGSIGDEEYNRLTENGASGFSTFMSYYILTAIASRDKGKAVKMLKEYYGKMIELGATTFWEDFDISWAENACGTDEYPKENQKDIHGDFGAFCYKGFRHSLCHGWSSGIIKFIKETQ